MNNIISKIKNMITLETRINMTKEQEAYVAGLSDALEIIEGFISENLIPGHTYFVIMYKDGNKHLPYIEEMKLYKVAKGRLRTSYCFTRNLDQGKYHYNSPDLVLQSKKGISERVFYTFDQANDAINHY